MAFASKGDTAPKKVSFTELADGVYAYTAEGDPNTGVVIGDDCVMVMDAQATPVMAKDVISHIRKVTDKPIKWLVLSHYHAVRVLGASAYEGARIVASNATRDLIEERGAQDWKSEHERFPRLFQSAESIPGLTWPDVTFDKHMTLWLGAREVHLLHLGRGHTKGDTVAWLPKEKILFAGDLVEFGATPYTGDAHLEDWPTTLQALEALGPEKLIPGRGEALQTKEQCRDAIQGTRLFLKRMYDTVKAVRARGGSLKQAFAEAREELAPSFGHWVIFDHCLPFDICRAYDEAGGVDSPRIWTAERDKEMWEALHGK